MIRLRLPIDRDEIRKLRAGDYVLLSGTMITGRDAAHARFDATLNEGAALPVDIRDETIYYVGPAPARPGVACGPAGPTSSYRMDAYTPRLLDRGLAAMIGKGVRSPQVTEAIVRNGAVYFAAVGGAAALLAKHIKRMEALCYEELGTEAVYRLEVEDFPVIVATDCIGGDVYAVGDRE